MGTETRYVELDFNVEPCPCGRLTANPWGLCRACTDDEANDKDFNRPLRLVDPNGRRA